jgi:hypothetical protein
MVANEAAILGEESARCGMDYIASYNFETKITWSARMKRNGGKVLPGMYNLRCSSKLYEPRTVYFRVLASGQLASDNSFDLKLAIGVLDCDHSATAA